MTERQFGVGEHKMRNGRNAIVFGELPQPSDSLHVLIGCCQNSDGQWNDEAWMSDGAKYNGCFSEHDLLSPDEVTYRRVPCGECRGSWNEEFALSFGIACNECRVEKIARRDGTVVSVELEKL